MTPMLNMLLSRREPFEHSWRHPSDVMWMQCVRCGYYIERSAGARFDVPWNFYYKCPDIIREARECGVIE